MSVSNKGETRPLHVHRVTTVGKVEAAGLLGVVGAKAKGSVRTSGLGHTLIGILLIIREVLLNNVVGLHVNLLVGVVLAIVDLLHATTLLNEESVTVDGLGAFTSSLLVEVTDLENVLKTVKSHLNDLVVGAAEKVAQGLDAALGDEVSDLLRLLQATRGSVANGPASLLASLEVTVLEKVNQRRDDVGIDNGLDLGRVAGSDVRDGPASLFADTVLSRAQKRQEAGQSAAVDDDLSLDIVTGDNVADGSEGGGLDGRGGVHKQLDQAAGDAGLDDGLDFVVGAIRKVGNSPASINQDLVIKRIDKFGQDGKSRGNLRGWY